MHRDYAGRAFGSPRVSARTVWLVDLSGTWHAAAADEGLRRAYPAPSFDDSSWATIEVPGHWRTTPAFSSHDGPILYRRRFDTTPLAAGRRGWLSMEGIFYQGDLWLDGSYLGDTEGYFFPHTFEVTDALRAGPEHLLAVEVSCTPPADRTAKRSLTGVFEHWDSLDPDWNPGGIWRPVRLSETGPVRISQLSALCSEARPERAVLDVSTTLDTLTAGPVRLVARLARADSRTTTTSPSAELATREVARVEVERALAAGNNEVRLALVVETPELWWPHALGSATLHELTVEVYTSETELSDRAVRQTGLRQVRMRQWILTVNGERLFLKGSNLGPPALDLAAMSPAAIERDVLTARRAGLDLLRIHAHIARPELYEAADRHGLLLWQDLPLQWGYARSVRRQATRQARAAVEYLGQHPSIAIWCGHNEPLALDVEPGSVDASPRRAAVRFAALQELPTWNKTVLDRSIKRALQRADPTRPVVAHSGVFPHPGSGGTDSHWYFGWYHGDERAFPALCRAMPRLVRFVGEFGAQAVPESAAFMKPERWPDLDWDRLGRTHALQRSIFERWVPPSAYPTFEAWRNATQEHQASVIRFHIETLRRLKYRPTGGFCQFSLADAYPAVTWSLLDHERLPKRGYEALASACAPVIVVATRPAERYRPGAQLDLDVHVVSDLRVAFSGVVTAELHWPGSRRTWRWEGDVTADSCVRIGRVRSRLGRAAGPVTLELRLSSKETDQSTPRVLATNSYQTVIEP